MIKETVRKLRKESTDAEKTFGDIVRNRKICGKKFFRQHPIRFDYYGKKRFFIADFYNAEHKLVVEIDGSIHILQKEYDELRTFIINNLGIKVIRFTNKEIENNINNVIQILKKELTPYH